MSVRALYQKIPASKRLCNYHDCPSPQILRNIDVDKNGRIYHHGCLLDAREEKYRCLECFTVFDATECGFVEAQKIAGDEISEGVKPVCPCGSLNVKKGLVDWKKEV